MAEGQVQVLDAALDGDLPVAGVGVLPQGAVAQTCEVAPGEEPVDGGHVLGERWRLAVDVDEDVVEPLAAAHGPQAQFLATEARGLVHPLATNVRGRAQGAVEAVGPGVPGAAQGVADAARLQEHAHAPVAADIVEAAHRARAVAQHDERPARKLDRHGVARIGDIGPDGDGRPDAREQLSPLQLVEAGAVAAPGQPDGRPGRPVERLARWVVEELFEGRVRHAVSSIGRA